MGSPTKEATAMAENQLTPRNDRVRSEARQTDWASLIARAVDDMTRIVHSELRLLSASMKTALDEEVDRVLAFVASGMLMLAGALCILAGFIMFLREYATLPWWQSFGIAALVLFAIAVGLRAFASSRSKPPAIS
jgi:hypothetical protein